MTLKLTQGHENIHYLIGHILDELSWSHRVAKDLIDKVVK